MRSRPLGWRNAATILVVTSAACAAPDRPTGVSSTAMNHATMAVGNDNPNSAAGDAKEFMEMAAAPVSANLEEAGLELQSPARMLEWMLNQASKGRYEVVRAEVGHLLGIGPLLRIAFRHLIA